MFVPGRGNGRDVHSTEDVGADTGEYFWGGYGDQVMP